MRFPFNIDLLSFWSGFLVATLFWFVVRRLVRLIPKLKEINKNKQEARKKLVNLETIFTIRKNTLRRCQSEHLFSAFFPLDDILVQPMLLAKKNPIDPDSSIVQEPLINQVIPYLPDWPELVGNIPFQRISLEKALSLGSNIILTGQQGAGKTVAMANLASQIAENKTSQFIDYLPVFLHYREFVFTSAAQDDPLSVLFSALQNQYKKIDKGMLEKTLLEAIEDNHLILFLDGYEEVNQSVMINIEQWLGILLKQYPHLHIVTTSSSYHTGKLTAMGFIALPVAAWTEKERTNFIQQWSSKWIQTSGLHFDQQYLSLITKLFTKPVSPQALTLSLWSSLNGINETPANQESRLTLLCQQLVPLSRETFVAIAEKIVKNDRLGLSSSELGLILAEDKLFTAMTAINATTDQTSSPKSRKESSLPTPDTVISDLLLSGILEKTAPSTYNFRFLSQLVNFFSVSPNAAAPSSWHTVLRSNFDNQVASSLFSQGKLDEAVNNWLLEDDTPLFRNLQIISRWVVNSSSVNGSIKNSLYKKLFQLVQDKNLPLSLRIRLLAPFVFTDDSIAMQVLKMLSSSSDEIQRVLAAIGLGIVQTPEATELLHRLTQDPAQTVQYHSCISLSQIWTSAAQKILVDLILTANESTRQLIAEVLASLEPEGHEILKELAVLENNIVARRASVFGLQLINQKWAREVLEKISINDSQWVVRNAAMQALESPDLTPLFVHEKLTPPSETPWLIKYASKLGIGLPAGDYPYDLFFKILSDPKNEYKFQALEFITRKPDANSVKKLALFMNAEHSEIRDSVFDSFMQFSQRGLIN